MKKEWKLLSEESMPPVNRHVILRDAKGSVTISKLTYAWDHSSYSKGALFPGDGKAYWMLLEETENNSEVPLEPEKQHEKAQDEKDAEKTLLVKKLLVPIEKLGISTRIINSFYPESIRFIGDVVCVKDKGFLLKIPGFGIRSLKELKLKLKERGFDIYYYCPEYFKAREELETNGGRRQ